MQTNKCVTQLGRLARAAAAVGFAFALAQGVAAAGDAGGPGGTGDSQPKYSESSWWLWPKGHSMQEQAFCTWMTARFGQQWTHTMQEEVVLRWFTFWDHNVWQRTHR
ncbi:MAG: hypothetical protein EXS00_03860 [Phycisphaerales bacterium]|nr:hypothetical protein [Phycisphaerales bacterium]